MLNYKGKYTKVRANDPRAVARCDYSTFMCMNYDLVKQMEYKGTSLVWNGFFVNKVFADKPNPQMMNPVVYPDPIPVAHPRPDIDRYKAP